MAVNSLLTAPALQVGKLGRSRQVSKVLTYRQSETRLSRSVSRPVRGHSRRIRPFLVRHVLPENQLGPSRRNFLRRPHFGWPCGVAEL
jgi:hypothetical protein